MISRRTALSALAAGLASGPSFGQTKSGRKPNIVIIVADDLGYGDLGCYGSPDVPTPHIDSIASDGIRFTSGYVSAPMCSPSRAALMTGRYQQRFGHEHNCGGAARDLKEHLGLPLTEVTLPQTLKGAGYVTGMVGKWHLGMNQEFHPLSRGFDDYFGFLVGANSYLLKSSPGGLDVDVKESDNMGILDERRQPVYRGRQPVREVEYITDAFGREAASFIAKNARNPFFLYLAFNAVHVPLQATQRYVDRFANIKDERHRMLAAMTSALDDNVGKVLASLRSNGLEKDTLVFFISDNGSPTYTRAGTNRPLNGGKLTLYEGGFRVPFMVKWPGKITPKQVVNTPITARDLFPTLAAAAGAVVPANRKLDGVDLMPHLTGGFKQTQIHDALFWRNGPNRAMRRGDWKLILIGDRVRLYNLAEDLGETRDLASNKPDTVAGMKAAVEKWESELVAPKWSSRQSVPIPINGEPIDWTV